ncbi:MAG: chemotaxis response regulator protein-glutamate methylesterase [Gammaproteobacteria bacterium]|nr:chemotaxis response regulator protein-glutamate methylesterase [Gammaproteobacteria bacterium]MDH5802635.1 chemotaxis response regulator protein-glutamate methylesterase [Gammaproteobacteria bacterium]
MAVRALVVDDSGFFRRRLTEMLSHDGRIEVIGVAVNGEDAVEKALRLNPDVITMDIEMPFMDGITATRKILQQRRIPIIMFSSLTVQGAQSTLDALEAGALDYIPKNFEDVSGNKEQLRKMLCDKVLSVVGAGVTRKEPTAVTPLKPGVSATQSPRVSRAAAVPKKQYKLVAIGASTGGPVALQKLLSKIPGDFKAPILIAQHMPAAFTDAFAKRLDGMCAIKVKEAADGDIVQPATALLAPGGMQMTVVRQRRDLVVKISEGDSAISYKPSVDLLFESVARNNPGNNLAIVLTGMGADGCKGARDLKNTGASIWAQDESSSVIYGMPHAVVEAGLADFILTLDSMGSVFSVDRPPGLATGKA